MITQSGFLNIKETAECYKQGRKHPLQLCNSSFSLNLHYLLILFPVKELLGLAYDSLH